MKGCMVGAQVRANAQTQWDVGRVRIPGAQGLVQDSWCARPTLRLAPPQKCDVCPTI